MEKIKVIQKDVELLVCQDGSIYRPSWTSVVKRVRNNVEQIFHSEHKETRLTPVLNNRGYLEVSVLFNKKRSKFSVHRLVAIAFVPGFEQSLTVNHINGDKLDNRPENLEWVTLAENTRHQWKTGLVDLRGENAPGHKLTQRQVIHIRKALRAGVSANSLAIIAGVNASTIYLIGKGKRWSSLADE